MSQCGIRAKLCVGSGEVIVFLTRYNYPFERKTPAFMPGDRSESLFRVDRVVVLNA